MSARTKSWGERLLSFAKEAPHARSRESLGESLLRMAEPLGVRRYACLFLRPQPGGFAIQRSISNVPLDWQKIYLARGYEVSDAVFQGAVRAGAYGFWSEMTRTMHLSQKAKEVIGFASQIQMLEGFTRRVPLDNGGVALMMVSGEKLTETEEARALLRLASDVFANEATRFLGGPSLEASEDEEEGFVPLSPTQMRVLALRAEGLTNGDVAERLNRKTKTIETHASQIIRRLNARNMYDAIGIAWRRSLLQ